jgi:PAS domain S-box-containing protein
MNLPDLGLPLSGDPSPPISKAPIRPDRPLDTVEAFDVLVEQASEYAIITLSPDGLIASWNQGAQRIKGYERDEIVGRHFSVLYLDSDREAGTPQRLLDEARGLGRVSTQGWRRRQDGTQF